MKDTSNATSVRSLVCDDCWAGPYKYESFRKLVSGEDVLYHTTWNRVQRATAAGCGLCGVLINDEDLKPDNQEDVTFCLRFYQFKTSTPLDNFHAVTPHGAQLLEWRALGCEPQMRINGVFLRTSSDDSAAREIVARDPILDVNSSHCFDLTMGHVEECLKNHANCPKPVSNGRLPTRVIDVLDPDHPHLFVSGDTHGEPYAALSYVWGEEQPNRTTLSNISTYVASIDLTLIPRTIREAMDVARRMGLRYLWVDSFCIIQDSRKDKTREIMQLRRIFRDAYITIIAASASSASSGFLEERSPPAPSPAAPRLPYWCADGRLGRVTAEPLFVSYEESRDEPANRRAWCLEERLLSPRRLVYANDTLQYHCQTSITYAGGALGRARTAERLPSFLFLPDAELAARVSQWKPFEWRAFQTEWLDVVMNYTRRLVTKPKDKLTALAGLAELFHRVWHHAPGASKSESNRYLAGLWGTILVHDLLWKRRNDLPVPFAPRPSRPYIAPSWSWASVDGPIDLWSGYDPRLRADIIACAVPTGQAKIMSCDVTVEDEGLPHGRVKDGLLRLQAKLIPTSWNPSLAGARLYLPRHQPGQSLRMMEAPLTAYEDLFSCVAEVFIDSADEVEGQVWAVPILWTRTTENADMYAAGLLITRGEDGIHYRRVGMWQTLEPDCTNDLEGDEEWEVETLLSWLVSFSEGDWSIIEIV